MTVTLCVVFNHPYPDNIPFIKQMYADKFDNIIFVQPFVRSDRDDVVVSHRGSFNFQGLIFDAIPRLMEIETDYVVFAQDDCLINPRLTKDNIIEELGVEKDRPFFGSFLPISGPIDGWHWMLPTVWRSFYSWSSLVCTGVENFIKYLPDAYDAKSRIERNHGVRFSPVTPPLNSNLRYGAVSDASSDTLISDALVKGLFATAPADGIELNYPWLFGMSDFLVMSIDSLERIRQFLGVTAAASIFAEVAIPTALAIHHETISSPSNNKWQLEYTWGTERAATTRDAITAAFDADVAVIHPVKLSKNREMVEDLYNR